MLFNSLVFLLVFLPVAVGVDRLVDYAWPAARRAWLLTASLVFYASFGLGFVPVLAASILLNWAAGRAYGRTGQAWILAAMGVADLAALAVYKYLDFAADLATETLGIALPHPELAFPLGISFFTFGHIAYLVDLKRGRAEAAGPLDYALYVAFFPKVVAGPLVRAVGFVPQLGAGIAGTTAAGETLARGALLFTAGLAKKVWIGDPLGEIVDPVFSAAAAGTVPGLLTAWGATIGYGLQLYFDFSGYSDMAMGAALLFGIRLPRNFEAPYRAVSIQDFWRRWHISLSEFLRDYLYIPFGGNRHGLPRQVLALMATMALGGLWHGAGLTFVLWGLAHGVALSLDLLWRRAGLRMPDGIGLALTLAFVFLAWVPFRADTLAAASTVYRGLLGGGDLGAIASGPTLLIAAALALVGPTAWTLVERLPPARWVAVAAALLLAACIVKVGDDRNAEFIYAQF